MDEEMGDVGEEEELKVEIEPKKRRKRKRKRRIKAWCNARKIAGILSGRIIRKHILVWTAIHSFFQILVIVFFLTSPSISFISFGPSDKLYVAGIAISSWGKYLALLTYITIAKMIRTTAQDAVIPFMQNHCYDTNVKVIYNYGRKEIIGLEFVNSVAFQFGHIFDLMVTISQIDLAVYELFVGEIVGSVILTFYLRDKEFVNSEQQHQSKNIEPNVIKINEEV